MGFTQTFLETKDAKSYICFVGLLERACDTFLLRGFVAGSMVIGTGKDLEKIRLL